VSTVEQRCAAEINLAKEIEAGRSTGCVPPDTITGTLVSRSAERLKPKSSTLVQAARRRVKNLKGKP